MQAGFTFFHRCACFGPDFRFHTAAADCASSLAIPKEQHLGPTPLRRRATRVRDRRNHNAFAAIVGVANHLIEIFLRDRPHDRCHRLQSVISPSIAQTKVCAIYRGQVDEKGESATETQSHREKADQR